MTSVQTSVIALYRKNPLITVDDLKKIFSNSADSYLRSALSTARKGFTEFSKNDKNFEKITEDEIEKVIIERLNKSLDNSNIRLAIDFLKIKRSESGLEDELDIEQYLKKVVKGDELTLITE